MGTRVKKSKKILSPEDAEKLIKLEHTCRNLQYRLKTAEKWMPGYVFLHPKANPKTILRELRTTIGKVKKEIDKIRKKGDLLLPEIIPMTDEIPLLGDRIHKALADARWIERLKDRGSFFLPGRYPSGEEPQEQDSVQVVTGVAMGTPWCCTFDERKGPWESNDGDFTTGPDGFYPDYMTSLWQFDPYLSIDYGLLKFRTDIRRCDDALMYHRAGLIFSCLKAPFDGILSWKAHTRLNVPYYLNGDYASFTVDWGVSEMGRIDGVSYSIAGLNETVFEGRNVGSFEREQIISGAFTVREGEESAIYLGLDVRIEVINHARAGTKRDWGYLQIIGPDTSHFWGLEFSYHRV